MKRKNFFASMLIMAALTIGGCSSENEISEEVNTSIFEVVGETKVDWYYITELRDTETGVHYLCSKNGDSKIGIYPRYNADGTLYVD